MKKLDSPRGLKYYLELAASAGFQEFKSEILDHTFYSQLVKE